MFFARRRILFNFSQLGPLKHSIVCMLILCIEKTGCFPVTLDAESTQSSDVHILRLARDKRAAQLPYSMM